MSRAEAGEPLPIDRPSATPAGWSRSYGLLNPLRAVWWLFTSLRFAVVLLAVLSAISLVGVLLPQLPPAMRGDPLAEAAWLASKEDTFGFLIDPMDALSLFDIFHARWFGILLAVTAVSTAAYVISRFAGVWASITQPRKRVPDHYFESAPIRLQMDERIDVDQLRSLLRAHRYRIERYEEGDATYLFADRFQWAQIGSLLTHSAVLLFIFAAVVSKADAFSSPLFLAEGSTLPVFPVRDADQMQVELVDEHAAFAGDGQPLDYRSDLVIYERGEQVKTCTSTVNSPCSHNGYRFYQSAYFGFGAALQVRDPGTGNVLYRETVALSDMTPSPEVTIRDSTGAVLLEGPVVLTESLNAEGVQYDGTLVTLSGGRRLTIGLRQMAGSSDQQLVVAEPGSGAGIVNATLREGATVDSGDLSITYVAERPTASAIVPDLPLPPSAGSGPTGDAFLQMTNVVYGTGTASEGTAVEAPAAGVPPALTIVGLSPQAITLTAEEAVTIDGYEYTFLGQREFAGIHVRRNRSDTLVWVAVALLVIGIIVTFWVPRRRLWAKITETRAVMAGQAPSHANYARELQNLALRASDTE